PDETGGPDAPGSAVNLALPAGTGDAGWLRAFHAVVPQVLRAYRPQILVTQCGVDTHRLDPLANLRLSVDCQRAGYLAFREPHDQPDAIDRAILATRREVFPLLSLDPDWNRG